MTHNRLREFLQTQFHNFLTFTYKATQILHKYSNKCGKKKHSEFAPLAYLQRRKEFLWTEDKEDSWQLCFQAATPALSLSPLACSLTCGGRSGSRIKARSSPRSCCRFWTSWRTHIIRAWKMVSSSGTLMSSLESSLTISAVGSSRNSWFWMTSRKCSWCADEGTGTGSRRLSAEGPKTRTKRGQKSAPVERSDAEMPFQLFQRQCHLFSPSRENKTIHSSGYKSIWRLKQEMRSLFKGLTRPENCWSSRQHWVITCFFFFFLTRNRKVNPNQYFHHTSGTFSAYFIR